MRRQSARPILLFILLAAAVLTLAARLRGPEYDEGYTAFVTAADPRPVWPAAPFRVDTVRLAFRAAPSPVRIADNLRRTDVHPPLYFWAVWAWRRLFGPDLFTTRLLSVLFSLGALGCLAALARRAYYPVLPALIVTLGAYGFVEPGIVARSFAMAQCLALAGLLRTLQGGLAESGGARRVLHAGLLLGAASFTNYLAAFTGAAAFVWLVWLQPRRSLWFALGATPFLVGDLFFFIAQRDSRIGQFPPFSADGMAKAVAHATGAALLGGLPLYVRPGLTRLLLAFILAALLGSLILLPLLCWQRIGRRVPHRLFALAALATPLGLCALGWLADSQPVEIRYLCFAIPPLALLVSAALGSLPQVLARAYLAILASVQAVAILGLMLRPETMQPEAGAARAAWAAVGERGLVLLPRGNDGVGIVSAFLAAAPGPLHVLLISPTTSSAEVATALCLHPWPRVTAAMIAADQSSRATLPRLRQILLVTSKCVDASAAGHLPYPPRS